MIRRLLALAIVIGAMGLLHAMVARPWFMRWGATDREVRETWPGDEFSPRAETVSTRAVTINAPADTV